MGEHEVVDEYDYTFVGGGPTVPVRILRGPADNWYCVEFMGPSPWDEDWEGPERARVWR